jgi:hypothetical protein
MIRLLICLLVVFGLATAPVMASVCAEDCSGWASHQQQGFGNEQPSDDGKDARTTHHCCHVNAAMPDHIAQGPVTASRQTFAVAEDGLHTSRDLSPLLEPPSPV